MADRWEQVAERLEQLAKGPLGEQRDVAEALGIDLYDTPAPVAAELIRVHLAPALLTKVVRDSELPERLRELEQEHGVAKPAEIRAGTRAEVSAWFAALYMGLTARGLRALQPQIGDVVRRLDSPGEPMIISSISGAGVVHMKGGRGKRSWPNHLEVVARNDGSDDYNESVALIQAQHLNAQKKRSVDSTELVHLAEYEVASRHPSPESLRELEDLLESGETHEAPFQKLLERNPELLASLVHGNWATYVIPQKRLGAEHVTDFLVLGLSSQGPEWIAVELEAPRHELLTKGKRLTAPVRHAVDQIKDWREWLGVNVAYARTQQHLAGITNGLAGLVIVGRADPAAEREPERSNLAEQERIHVHSWDWLLRDTQRIVEAGHQGATVDIA